MHFLAVGVDVPDAVDGGGEGLVGGFGEVELGFAQGGEGAGEGGVFDGVGGGGGLMMGWRSRSFGGVEQGSRWVVIVVDDVAGSGCREGGGCAGVTDGVLAGDDGAVFQSGGDVVGEIGDDGGQDGGA